MELGRLMSWIIGIFFLLILLSMLFGHGGWYTKTVGIIAGIFTDYGHIADNQNIAISSHPKTFDTFVKDFQEVAYSSDKQCIRPFTMPDDFDNYKINFKKSSDGVIMTITTKDDAYGGRGRIEELRTFNNLRLCVIYPSYNVQNFIMNLDEKEKNGRFFTTEEFTEYDEVEIVDGQLHIIKIGKWADFEKFYLFKPDENTVCFMPNSEHWYNSNDCTYEGRDVIDPNCWDKIKHVYPECRESTISAAISKGLPDMINYLSSKRYPFGSHKYYPIDVINNLGDIDTGIPAPPLVIAIMYQESRGNVNAVSGTGAHGAMQIIRSTASGIGDVCYKGECDTLCDDSCRTIDNRDSMIHSILGGYKVYKDDYDQMKSYCPKNTPHDEILKLAMAAYNGGPSLIKKSIDRSIKRYNYVSWDTVSKEIKPSDISQVGKYFRTYEEKKAKVDEILNYVDLVSNYYGQARGILMARHTIKTEEGGDNDD